MLQHLNSFFIHPGAKKLDRQFFGNILDIF